MPRPALAAVFAALAAFFRASHFALYQTVLYAAALIVGIHLFSNYSWAMSAICAGEMVAGFWIVQGIFALASAKSSKSGNRSID